MAKLDIGQAIEIWTKLEPVVKQLLGLFKKKAPAPADIPPAPGPVQVPAGTVPQVPINTRPSKIPTSVVLACTSVELPGQPGVNYPDHQGMINSGSNFNFGCASFWNGQVRDQNGDEFLGPDLIQADLEYRTTYRVYKDGQVVSIMQGEGDNNPTGEGQPAPWHQSESAGVGFGVSRWLNSAGLDNRIMFRGEGRFEVELEVAGIKSRRVPFNVS